MSNVVTALEDWLENDEGVVKFGLQLKQEWVDVAALGFIAGYEAALTHLGDANKKENTNER